MCYTHNRENHIMNEQEETPYKLVLQFSDLARVLVIVNQMGSEQLDIEVYDGREESICQLNKDLAIALRDTLTAFIEEPTS